MISKVLAGVLALGLLTLTQEIFSWLLVIVGIGFLIFIHELGHFAVAKYEGVRVEAFALGFGPPLFKRHANGTDYRINLIPLGGYVKMAGELPGEGTTGASDEFTSKRPAQRARILVAGVLMNAAFGIFGIILAVQMGVRFVSPTVGAVLPGKPAWKAGLQKGDTILSVNGEEIIKFTKLFVEVAFSDGEEGVQLKIKRGDEILDCRVFPEYDPWRGLPTIGVAPFTLSKINVQKDSPAYEAGLRNEDMLVAINGQPVADGHEAERLLEGAKKAFAVEVRRDGELLKFRIDERQKLYRIGIAARQLQIGGIRRVNALTSELTKKIAALDLQEGDIIIAVDGQPVANRGMLAEALGNSSQRMLTIDRNGEQRQVNLPESTLEELFREIHFAPELYIGAVLDKSPAAEYLQQGDKLLAINGRQLERWTDVVIAVQEAQGSPITVTYLRDGEEMTATMTPKREKINTVGLGFYPKLTEPLQYGIWKSFKLGWSEAVDMVRQIFLSLKGIFTSRVSSKNLGGPVLIFQASYTYLQLGLGRFIHFLAVISINLAVINLLPIPVLDGGHLMLLGIEKARGKPLSEESLVWANYFGLLLLLTLIIYVTWNDISRLFSG